ncbi:MAG: hypothetical protein M1834_009725 [Cirrosporium novae-zelandiae]|nr:MAG: hypothetical protein M1834_009725 [Cirrosporium novae-zelandiae]
MPPANSPTDTPSNPTTANESPYLQQLQAITSPVPNLAATLTTASDDDANEGNISFVRTRLRESSDNTLSLSRRRRQALVPDDEFEQFYTQSDNQRRMRRALDFQRRYSPELSESLRVIEQASSTTYSNRVPSRQSLYDWAPARSNTDEDATYDELQRLIEERRQIHRDRHPGLSDIPTWRPVPLPVPESRSTYSQRSGGRSSMQPPQTSMSSESSLQRTALLQSVRRHPRFSSRSRSNLQSFVLDRERTGQDAEDRDRPGTPPEPPSREAERERRAQSRRALDYLRQRYLENSPHNAPSSSPLTEKAITYLERLRFSSSYEESLMSAAAGGFACADFLGEQHEDFILDTASIDPPPPSSWLCVGSVFSGHQRATSSLSSVFTSTLRDRDERNREILRFRDSEFSQFAPIRSNLASSIISNFSPSQEDQWPVRVTLHGVDYSTMTLAGTMEAHSIPDKASPTNETSITTYLEGEIIDFNNFTLETKSYKADAKTDSTYWRKLEPFKGLSDDEIAVRLLSRKWLIEELSKNWVLMRWKEKCFITPSSHRSGLTISGFYYISMRRDDGRIEGLYYDPGSSPYQHLTLTPEKKTFPTYEFR